MRLENARYHLSVHDPRKLPPGSIPEIAFLGRSNAGKSSALNTLAGRRRLAFVDLPGYGYAGVPMEVRRHWDTLVGEYVFHRNALAGLIVVMDARHPLAAQDLRLLDWLLPSGRNVHVLLSKSDKLSAQAAHRTLASVRKDLAAVYPGATAQLFSSLKRSGTAEAQAVIEGWATARKQKAPAKGE